jgi:DNA polymerase-3 subunit gamma/tau
MNPINNKTPISILNVKSLIDAAQWSPQELQKKVYLIDEFHQLTKEAISALLKILEEFLNFLVFQIR